MNDSPALSNQRTALRAAALLAGLYLALAVGVPWLLHDAPPSPEAAFAARACCASTTGAQPASPAQPRATAR